MDLAKTEQFSLNPSDIFLNIFIDSMPNVIDKDSLVSYPQKGIESIVMN